MESQHTFNVNELPQERTTDDARFQPETVVIGYLKKWQDAANEACEARTKLEPHTRRLVMLTNCAVMRVASVKDRALVHTLDAANDETYAQDDIENDPVYKLKHAA